MPSPSLPREHDRDEHRLRAAVRAALTSARDTTEMLSEVAAAATKGFADLCVVDVADCGGRASRVTVTCRDPTRAWLCEALTQTPLDRDQPLLTWSVMQSSEPVLAQAPPPEAIVGLPPDGGDPKLRGALDLASVIAAPLRAGDQTLGVLSLAVFNAHAPYAAGDLQLAAELAWMTALSLENDRLATTVQDAAGARVGMLRTVSHDLRAPLNAIVLQTQLLRRAIAGEGGRAQRTIEAIGEATEGMNRMLQDVVDLARAEAGLMVVHRDRVPAVQLVRDYANARTTFVNSIPVEVDAPQNDIEIWADLDRLWQLLDIWSPCRSSPPNRNAPYISA